MSECSHIKGATGAQWAPKAFTVSFKLETNSNILIAKAANALKVTHSLSHTHAHTHTHIKNDKCEV